MQDQDRRLDLLTRKQLYDLVWQTPMRRLAERFGISDVAIAKMCKRHQVPRPPRGHWAKLKHGKPVDQPALPEVDDPGLDVVRVGLGKPREVAEPDLGEAGELPEVEVAPELTDPHRLVAKTDRSITGAKPDERGVARPRAAGCLDVRLTPGSIDRTMRILDAIVKAVERGGGGVETQEKHGKQRSVFVIEGEAIPFWLEEDVRREERELTPQEERKYARSPWRYCDLRHVYRATGRLVLQLDLPYLGDRQRRRWADGKRQRLEDLLPGFLGTLFEYGAQFAARTRRWEAERQREEERQRIRAGKCEEIREEEDKLNRLLTEFDRWTLSRQLREFIDDAVTRFEAEHGPAQSGSDLAEWVSFATKHADRLDPVLNSPPSILDEKEKWGYGRR